MHLFKTTLILLVALVLNNSNLLAQLCTPDPGQTEPTLSCSAAPVVCELNNFCGILPDEVSFPDQSVSSCPNFSALNNPSFFKFIATSNSIGITVVYANCNTNSPGIQIAILPICPAPGGQMHVVPGTCFSSCNEGPAGANGSTTIGGNQFNIGQAYWFILDGCSGSVCEFQIVNTVGIESPSLEGQEPAAEDLSGPVQTVCPGEAFVVSITNEIFANQFVWEDPFSGQITTTEPHILVRIPRGQANGTYTLCLTDADNGCSPSLKELNPEYEGACFSFTVEQIEEMSVGPFDICLGESYVIDGRTFTPDSAGISVYQYELFSGRGCDSIINLTLNTLQINNEVFWTDSTLVAVQENASYQWVDCDGYIPIDGATGQTFEPQESGLYAVEITTNGCVNVSDCIEVIILSNHFHAISDPMFFYPNPSRNTLNFELKSPAQIVIYDNQGKVLSQEKFASGKNILDVSYLQNGFYFAKVYWEQKVIVQKIIIQK